MSEIRLTRAFFIPKQKKLKNLNQTPPPTSKLTKKKKKDSNMAWPFCPSCRSTLKVDAAGEILCEVCPYRNNLSQMSEIPTKITYSSSRPTPLWAKSDAEQAALKKSQQPTRATIEEPCVKCNAPEVGYYTVQLRSVDEGQTVFYECPNCNYTWSINN